MKLIIRLFVKKIRISLFNHFFIVTYIKHISLKFHTMNTSFTQTNHYLNCRLWRVVCTCYILICSGIR